MVVYSTPNEWGREEPDGHWTGERSHEASDDEFFNQEIAERKAERRAERLAARASGAGRKAKRKAKRTEASTEVAETVEQTPPARKRVISGKRLGLK